MNHFSFLLLRRHRHALLLIIYLLIIAALWYLPGVFHPRSVEDVRRWVMGFGVWGPLVYVLLYTVRPLLLFPSLLLNVTAGILFPPVVGIPCLLAGGLGSAALLFYMARTGIGASSLTSTAASGGRAFTTTFQTAPKTFSECCGCERCPCSPMT